MPCAPALVARPTCRHPTYVSDLHERRHPPAVLNPRRCSSPQLGVRGLSPAGQHPYRAGSAADCVIELDEHAGGRNHRSRLWGGMLKVETREVDCLPMPTASLFEAARDDLRARRPELHRALARPRGCVPIGLGRTFGCPAKERLANAETDRPPVIFYVCAGPPSLVEVLEYVTESLLAGGAGRPCDDVGFA